MLNYININNLIRFFILIYLFVTNKNLYEILLIDIAHNSFLKFFFFLCISITFFIIFYSLLAIKSRIIRFSIFSLFFFSSFISQTFYDISGNTININDLEIAKLNFSLYGGFYVEYKKVIIKNFIIFLFALILVINSQNINIFFTTFRFRFLSLFFFIFLFVFSFFRGGFGTQGLPSQLQVLVPFPFLFMTSNYEIIYDNIEIKEEIQNKLVLIIDESISYKYFQKALKISDENIDYFLGLKPFYSIHNCSAQSVFALINGMQFKDSKMYLRENLWSLAKKNGYKTTYISAQEKDDRYQYMQSPEELRFIDKKIFFGNFDRSIRDELTLKKLINLIDSDEKQFIVVIKNGSHFPYHAQFNLEKYNLTNQQNIDTIYMYSIKENSVDYLKKLISIMDKKTEIIYISDHGQYIAENKLTHCNSINPNVNEWIIPFLYYSKFLDKKDNIKISNLTLYDFILAKFGYSVDISSEETNYLFYGNINQRFGNELKYMQAN